MASFSSCPFLILSFFLLFFSLPHGHHAQPSTTVIEQACRATRYLEICVKSLAGLVSLPNPNSSEIIQAAISVPAENFKVAQEMVKKILDATVSNANRTNAAQNSMELLHNSVYRTELTARAMNLNPGSGTKAVKDARAWLSGTVTYVYSIWSALSYVNDTQDVIAAMVFLNATMCQSSNALSMIRAFDVYGSNISKWAKPQTERDGFWEEPRSRSRFKPGGVSSDLTVNVTVCNDGSGECSHETVQKAVEAAPKWSPYKFVIHIKKGVYNENVNVALEKTNLVFLGDGKGQTVITGNLSVHPGRSTYNTATVGKYLSSLIHT